MLYIGRKENFMATTQVLRRRGTEAENNVFTGGVGEITIDTTNHSIRVHDGATVGGYVVPTRELASSQTTPGSYAKVTVDHNGFVTGGETLVESDIPDLSTRYIPRNTAITAGTKAKITYDSKGLVTAGADLVTNDIPALPISKITDLQSALDSKQKNIPVKRLTKTIGVLEPEDNSINYVEITGTCTIQAPSVTSSAGIHQFVVQLKKLEESWIVNLGTAKYFGGVVPTIAATGYYNIYYEYDYNMNDWVVGAIYKGNI